MIFYLDTSALVKLYVEEKGSDRVKKSVTQAKALATHDITYVEILGCFGRLNREEVISGDEHECLKGEFEGDWPHYLRISINKSLLKRAAEFAEAFALRAYDSVHLAAAYSLHLSSEEPLNFGCFDKKLNRAAHVLGLISFTD